MSSNVTSAAETPRCKILKVGSAFLIWNVDDAANLRKQQRIVGALIGTMPKATHQNDQLSLPLKLMQEQVRLLVDRGMAEIVQYKSDTILPQGEEYRKAYDQWFQLEMDRQVSELHKKIVESRLTFAHQIVVGRKAKLRSGQPSQKKDDANGEPKAKRVKVEADNGVDAASITVTAEEVTRVEEEIRSTPMPVLKPKEMLKEIWNDSPLFVNNEQFEPMTKELIFRTTELERLRYNVFVDLWEKGYYLTSGLKFGGDFLAYPDDPLLCHASYIVICLLDTTNLPSIDLSAFCRLGTQVKKIALLSTWSDNKESKIAYTTLEWKRTDNEKS